MKKKYEYVVIKLNTVEDVDILKDKCQRFLPDIISKNRLKLDINTLYRNFNNIYYDKPLVYMIKVPSKYTIITNRITLIASPSYNKKHNGFQSVHNCELFKEVISYKAKKFV